MFQRPVITEVKKRLLETRRFIQVLAGPRQTGKTTLIRQVLDTEDMVSHYATADEPALKDRVWMEQQWEVGRRLAAEAKGDTRAVLVLDEVQKIPNWSETVKRLWDEDTASQSGLHVVVLGSAPLLMQRGLAESLAGRFETIPVTHWSLAEMQEAFGLTVDQYVYYGGYPGAAPLIHEPERWRRYVLDSLIETTISRDVLLMQRVDKPALLRQLFELGCSYSGQILSYSKLVGQLQEAGNTTTLAHYLELLGSAGLLEGLRKYAGQKVRRRGSSPKFQVHNNALISAQSERSIEHVQSQPELWGRLVESAIGTWLINGVRGTSVEVYYWQARNREVDFVLARGQSLVAIEVKSGRHGSSLPGIDAFASSFGQCRKLLVGGDGIKIDEFLVTPVTAWFEDA